MNPIIPILVASLTIGAGATYVAHDAGYVPVKEFMETEEPVGYQQVCSECVINNIPEYQTVKDEIPNLEKIKYEFYISTSNYLEIIQDYKDQLKNDGYKLEYQGEKIVKNITIHYAGFIKGLTAVGIAITSGEEFNYPEAESIVLYTTGNVLDYKEIYNWYINESDGNI